MFIYEQLRADGTTCMSKHVEMLCVAVSQHGTRRAAVGYMYNYLRAVDVFTVC